MCKGLSFTCVALLVGTLAGCGESGPPTADVSGKISYQGKPLTVGTVTFVKGEIVASGMIQSGEYKVVGAPVGPVKISVITPAAPSTMQMKQKVEGKTLSGGGAEVVAVPPTYSNPDASGLTYTVTEATPQTYDIELK